MGKANRKPWLSRVAVIAFLLAGSLALQGCDNNLVNGPPDIPGAPDVPGAPDTPGDQTPPQLPPQPPEGGWTSPPVPGPLPQNLIGTSPDTAVARFQHYLSQDAFEYLFPRRMGTPYWANATGRTGEDYFSYQNLLDAIRFMSNLVIVTHTRQHAEGYFFWNARQSLLRKDTGQLTTISYGTNWDEPWHGDYSETARLDFGEFINSPNANDRRRELAAFLANVTQETARGLGVSRSYGGLFYNEEVDFAGQTGRYYWAYAYGQPDGTPHPLGPAQPGRSYHGRGPMQLSWNYNYGQASAVIFGDMMVLLLDPNRILRDGVLGWKTAIWFWMTPQAPRPSCHEVMTGRWTGNWSPTSTDAAQGQTRVGFGHTIMVINGGYEGDRNEYDGRILGRTSSYRRFARVLGADITGEKVDTLGMLGNTWFQ